MTATTTQGIRSVWAYNLHQEMALIATVVYQYGFRHAAIDTEFPGVYYHTEKPHYCLSPDERYTLLKANVDKLSIIQLGLTLYNDYGQYFVWEFNFKDFDIKKDPHNLESINLLKNQGLNFDLLHICGIDSQMFAMLMWWYGLIGQGPYSLEWVAFSSAYDFAYLVKVLDGGRALPETMLDFLLKLQYFFGDDVLDVKHMMKSCKSTRTELFGSLERVAKALDVSRAMGEAHHAGSDSLLLCHALLRMKKKYLVNSKEFQGVLCGLQVA